MFSVDVGGVGSVIGATQRLSVGGVLAPSISDNISLVVHDGAALRADTELRLLKVVIDVMTGGTATVGLPGAIPVTTGHVQINSGGSLGIDGPVTDLRALGIDVRPGGILSGVGIINAPVVVHGGLRGGEGIFFSGQPGGVPGQGFRTLAINGDFSLISGSMADLAVGLNSGAFPPPFGVVNDRVDVVGTATLGGTLLLSAVPNDVGFPPPMTAGDVFTQMTWTMQIGEFDAIAGIGSPPGLDYATEYGATGLTITAVIPGDVNKDGVVDQLDADIIAANTGLVTTRYVLGDVDGSGTVDAVDLSIVNTAGGLAGPAAVPSLSGSGVIGLVLALFGLLVAVGPRVGEST